MDCEPRHLVFQGTVAKDNKEHLTVRLFPGLDLDLRKKDIAEVEEATDEVTQRAYVRVKLKEDAEISANFKPRLARLALAGEGVPFAFGGTTPDAHHALPSGSVESIVPCMDPRGLEVFRGRVPSETWGILAATLTGQTVAQTSKTVSQTNYDTDTKSDRAIHYDTPVEVNGRITHVVDHETIKFPDDEKTDTKTDTKSGDW